MQIFTIQIGQLFKPHPLELPGSDFSPLKSLAISNSILEISSTSNFDEIELSKTVDTNEALISNYFLANAIYYWRIVGYSEYRTCGGVSATATFQTSNVATPTIDLQSVTHWSILPNPVYANTLLRLQLNASSSFKGKLLLHSVTGKVMLEMDLTMEAGQNEIGIPTTDLPKGLYLVSLESGVGASTKKLIIH